MVRGKSWASRPGRAGCNFKRNNHGRPEDMGAKCAGWGAISLLLFTLLSGLPAFPCLLGTPAKAWGQKVGHRPVNSPNSQLRAQNFRNQGNFLIKSLLAGQRLLLKGGAHCLRTSVPWVSREGGRISLYSCLKI